MRRSKKSKYYKWKEGGKEEIITNIKLGHAGNYVTICILLTI